MGAADVSIVLIKYRTLWDILSRANDIGMLI